MWDLVIKGDDKMTLKSLRTNDCIDEIINKYSSMIYRIALTHTRSSCDADDIFQEVFFRYFKSNATFNSEEHRKAWLINVTLKCCKKLWSCSWNKKTMPLDNELSVEMSFEESNVYNALLELPTKYRTVIFLFYFEEMSIEEIHQTLGIKHSTIRTQLTRGRTMLREKLKGEYFYE